MALLIGGEPSGPPDAGSGPGASRPALKRTMALWMATALVVGNMVGSGVFLLPASLADTAGPISMLAWIYTGAGAMLLALVFANLGRAFPKTGGPYAYARRAFGDFVRFQTAWGYWIAVWAGNAGWILLQGRVPLAAAQDGLFPKSFAKVHGERATPVSALSSHRCSSPGWCS